MFCNKCGQNCNDGLAFCPSCGNTLAAPAAPAAPEVPAPPPYQPAVPSRPAEVPQGPPPPAPQPMPPRPPMPPQYTQMQYHPPVPAVPMFEMTAGKVSLLGKVFMILGAVGLIVSWLIGVIDFFYLFGNSTNIAELCANCFPMFAYGAIIGILGIYGGIKLLIKSKKL